MMSSFCPWTNSHCYPTVSSLEIFWNDKQQNGIFNDEMVTTVYTHVPIVFAHIYFMVNSQF